MKTAIFIALVLICTGCITTPNRSQGPGSTTQHIEIRQENHGAPLNGTTTVSDKGETSGGIVINFISYERDKVTETADDNSQAKNATSEVTPTVDVTP